MPMKKYTSLVNKGQRSRLKKIFVSFFYPKLFGLCYTKMEKLEKSEGKNMFVFIAGMVGVIVSALIVTASAALHSSYKERKRSTLS